MSELKLLTIEEVMDLLKIRRKTVYNYIQRGLLRPIRISSKKVMFDKRDIEAVIEKLKEGR